MRRVTGLRGWLEFLAVVIVCLGLISSFCFILAHTTTGNTYPCTMVVSELDRENDIVYCVDFNGFEYSFYGCEDWHYGDIASCIMDDMGTTDVRDDEIKNVQYGGWIEGAWGWDGVYPVLVIEND